MFVGDVAELMFTMARYCQKVNCLCLKLRYETGLSTTVKYFTDRSKAVLLLWIIYVISVLFLLCFYARLFIDALWSPAGKRLTSWLSFVMFNCVFVTFPCGILGQVWYVIVSIPDLCHLSYLSTINEVVSSFN